MAKSKVVKDALVEEEKITKSKKKEEKEEIKEVKVEEKKEAKKEKKEKVKKEKIKKEKKDGYFKKLYRELRKVSWPSLGEVIKYSFAVIIFCVILVLFFELVSLLASFIKSVV